RRVEGHLRDLGVAGGVGAHLLVGRIRRHAAAVADADVHHAMHPAEHVLHAPETARSERRLLVAHRTSRVVVPPHSTAPACQSFPPGPYGDASRLSRSGTTKSGAGDAAAASDSVEFPEIGRAHV